jgi:phosphatidylglycerophosphatase A
VSDRSRAGLDRLAVLVGSFAMTGFAPVAPATVASAAATVVLAFVYPLGSPLAYAAVIAAVFAVGVWAATRLERLYGHDPSAAVIDEVLGMALTLAGAPIGAATLVLGFVFFRVFDILKLAPGRRLERLPGGWGVMADDACAGVYAAVLLQLVLRLWPEPRLAAWQLLPAVAAAGLLLVFRKPLLRRYGKARCDPRTGLRADGGAPLAPREAPRRRP